MDIGKATETGRSTSRGIRHHAMPAPLTLVVIAVAAAGLTLALWPASFFFVASQHVNPPSCRISCVAGCGAGLA